MNYRSDPTSRKHVVSNAELSIEILYFAAIRELLGVSQETLSWPSGSAAEGVTVQQLSERLVVVHPALAGQLSSVRFAVNEQFVALSAFVCAGDVVALIPPVSGG